MDPTELEAMLRRSGGVLLMFCGSYAGESFDKGRSGDLIAVWRRLA